ncbi:MAG: peroxiredoxin [Ideonella sp.]|nr:peroxiredoxin [Ideonella sp.]
MQIKSVLGLSLALLSPIAWAALPVGAPAPMFQAESALGGKSSSFALQDALKKGPVVLFFYPKAFTSGCTVEAQLFAEATPKFQSLNTTVIGMSNDDIDTLKRFSIEACRNKFAVAADAGGRIMKAYDASLMLGVADRISYAISPDGKIMARHVSMKPEGHVAVMLSAIEQWHAQQKR